MEVPIGDDKPYGLIPLCVPLSLINDSIRVINGSRGSSRPTPRRFLTLLELLWHRLESLNSNYEAGTSVIEEDYKRLAKTLNEAPEELRQASKELIFSFPRDKESKNKLLQKCDIYVDQIEAHVEKALSSCGRWSIPDKPEDTEKDDAVHLFRVVKFILSSGKKVVLSSHDQDRTLLLEAYFKSEGHEFQPDRIEYALN